MLLAASLALLMAAQPASPEQNFEEGKRLYFDLEYELAVFRFRDAARTADWEPGKRAVAYAWLGLAYAQIAELSSAKEAFSEAVKLDANIALAEEASPPPKAVQLMQEAKQEVANAPPPPPPPPDDGGGATPPAPPPPPTHSEPSMLSPILLYSGVGLVGAGLVTAAVGGAFGFLASSEQQAGVAATYQDEAAAHKEAAESYALGANISFGVAAGLVVIGGVLMGTSFVVE
jgi:tetratricopeptide (TPR) repeat protein